jgi:hypothetical protein
MFSFKTLCRNNGKIISKSGSDSYRKFFHISLHSPRTKYIEEYNDPKGVMRVKSDESRFICGYYKKQNVDEEGSGIFHYKIDNVGPIKMDDSKSCEKTLDGKYQPYVQFDIQPDTLQMTIDDPRFKNIEGNPQLVGVDIDLLVYVHFTISNLFVEFWNRCVSVFLLSRDDEPYRSCEFLQDTSTQLASEELELDSKQDTTDTIGIGGKIKKLKNKSKKLKNKSKKLKNKSKNKSKKSKNKSKKSKKSKK